MQIKLLVLLAGSAALLTACSGNVKQALGLKREGPDAFKVVSHPPLDMPPEFNLVPPQPGAARPQRVVATDKAAQAVYGDGVVARTTFLSHEIETTPSESYFLKQAGAATADRDIRNKIAEDAVVAHAEKDDDDGVLGYLRSLGSDSDDDVDVLDPTEELERLREGTGAN